MELRVCNRGKTANLSGFSSNKCQLEAAEEAKATRTQGSIEKGKNKKKKKKKKKGKK